MAEWTVILNDRAINTFSINEMEKVTIGRGSEADVVIDNTAISRLHTALELISGVYYVHDLKSTNGTFVNGKKITDMTPVSENDVIEFGKFRLTSIAVSDSEISSSYASDMDSADETVFIMPKAGTPEKDGPKRKPRFDPVKEGHRLVVLKGNATPIQLSLKGKTSVKIGKDYTCDLRVKYWFVARAQCYIIMRGERYFIVPQSSWASTRLNGLNIKDEKELCSGDIIEIRDAQIQFG